MADPFDVQLARASLDLKAMSTEVRREIRPALRKIARPMIKDAKDNADWSSRIPGAIRLSVLKRGVSIRVSRRKAPHARAYEGIAGRKTFRHPVFGDREHWVEQKTRPFLDPAVQAHAHKIRPAMVEIIEDAARRHGYK